MADPNFDNMTLEEKVEVLLSERAIIGKTIGDLLDFKSQAIFEINSLKTELNLLKSSSTTQDSTSSSTIDIKEIIANIQSTALNEESTTGYILRTEKGKPVIFFQNQLFHFHHEKKNSTYVWHCKNFATCKVKMETSVNTIGQEVQCKPIGVHDCTIQDNKLETYIKQTFNKK